MRASHRGQAARAAALAGSGQGEDPSPPDEPARQALRQQALGWLKAELAGYVERLEAGRSPERASIPRRLGLWRIDPAFAPLRDPKALDRLPESERDAWRGLWSEAETVRKRAMRLGVAATVAMPPAGRRHPD